MLVPDLPVVPGSARFEVRAATADDAAATAAVEIRSWRASYAQILPARVLDNLDLGARTVARRRVLADRVGVHLVAADTTYHDVVGFCDAGPARRAGRWAWEVYTIYLDQHARYHGLGREMFDHVFAWVRARREPSLIVWVLEANVHARRFYEAMGGRAAHTTRSVVDGFPTTEQAYVWDRI